MLREIAAMAAWSNTAPLGTPVVPLVHTTHAGSESAISGSAAVGAVENAASRSWSRSTVPGLTPDGGSMPSPVTVTTGSVRSRMLACSRGPRRRLMAEVIAPARSAPR